MPWLPPSAPAPWTHHRIRPLDPTLRAAAGLRKFESLGLGSLSVKLGISGLVSGSWCKSEQILASQGNRASNLLILFRLVRHGEATGTENPQEANRKVERQVDRVLAGSRATVTRLPRTSHGPPLRFSLRILRGIAFLRIPALPIPGSSSSRRCLTCRSVFTAHTAGSD